MSADVTIAVRILDNEYQVRCPADQLEELRASAGEVDQRMRQVRDEGKVAGMQQVAIMVALNIAHDAMKLRRQLDGAEQALGGLGERLQTAIDAHRGA